ncbi:Spy/CpxP family protein refolding chaperone [Ramlibacter sp. AW1]|uniref:Spy/CpxP family protein refolding chaperone n=1 Tax=Ramlibacter aurantiacus TaxID=2801330 RepID=A0A936ZPX6_9BURK|nr:Spy/CpxP family protein refolding chaperone [Ramlibacter aurantiacus]MBL0421293.1 Spy/CpxP family protein refolding chaperone [Ramlibacter aurantiacus]
MTSIRSSLVATALLAALAGGAFAQAPAAPPSGQGQPGAHRGHRDPAQMQERFQRRMADLKQKLQLTPGQEGAWTEFTTQLQPQPRGPRMDRDAWARMTTPERIDRMRSLRAERMAQMDQRAEATKSFYATLTPEQKKTFDELGSRGMRRGGDHGQGHRHHAG